MEIMNTDFSHHVSSDLSSAHPPEPSAAHPTSRKKRTKFIRIVNSFSGEAKPRAATKKPDPSAPKITRPCTECGKKFWSWKALFGHMRCHPERKWRGINPPPHFRRRPDTESSHTEEGSSSVTEEDHEVAACLLMLASAPAAADQSPSVTTVNQSPPEYSDPDPNPGRFECSSCKKVFGSHQALGGHRASHKNVKGCYAITKNDGDDEGCCSGETTTMMMMTTMMIKDVNNGNNNMSMGHKCGICFRVFPSGQALGGHMRCHWEKVEDPSRVFGLDLNVAAPLHDDDDDDASSPAEGVALDLRLGL